RDVDLIMGANFAKFKRHFALFTAIRRMPAHLRIVLIGQDQDGRTMDTIQHEARCFGVGDRFRVLSNQAYRQVVEWLCRARASVILSRREGSCVVVAESLFAGTPAAGLGNAELGSRAFLHAHPGRFLDEDRLAEQLTDFVERADSYTPRQWAVDNISCFKSTATLNSMLKRHALANGGEWTRDIVPLCWRPDPCPAFAADRER